MLSVNTNTAMMSSINITRQNRLEFNSAVEKSGTGRRINHGADDASGLAISSVMEARMRGISTAVSNIQDDINLIHTADAAVGQVQDALLRMRDLTLRLANRATMDAAPKSDGSFPANPSPTKAIKEEMSMLSDAIKQLGLLADYNGKGSYPGSDVNNPIGLLYGAYSPEQMSQIGADNQVSHQIGVSIPSIANLVAAMNAAVNPLDPPPDAGDQAWLDFATAILDDIDEANGSAGASNGLPFLADARAELGVLENRLKHALVDLQAEYVGIARSKSKIQDANMAEVYTGLTATMIKQQSATAVAAQANDMPKIATKLLGAIFDGMLNGPFSGGVGSAGLGG